MTVKEVFEKIGLGLPEGCDRIIWGYEIWEPNQSAVKGFWYTKNPEGHLWWLRDDNWGVPFHGLIAGEDVTNWAAYACYIVLPKAAQELLSEHVFYNPFVPSDPNESIDVGDIPPLGG